MELSLDLISGELNRNGILIQSKNTDNQLSPKNIVTDHRKLQDNDIFIAIKGTRFDGHSVISQVSVKLALVVVEDRTIFDQIQDLPVILVKDSQVLGLFISALASGIQNEI